MSHLIVLPVVLPALLAPVMAMAMRHDLVLQRTFGLAGQIALLALAVALATRAFSTGEIDIYELGAWPAPFGIVLVLDRLSATMLMLSAALGVIVTLYAIGSGWDRRGWHFHALFAFQMMGVNGAFLTGDAFNLFVFFEVLLIASYGLVIHSGGAFRLQAGLQYVVMNLAGSTLFLFALGTLYAVLGTLNMADMAVKAAQVAPEETALLAVGAVLLLLVFAVKAAAFPVQFWLPATYSAAPAPVAALFAIMTKVGAYAIIRVYTLIFGEGTPELSALVSAMLLPAALVTLVVGAVGVLGSARVERAIAFSVLASMGTLLTAVALFTPAGLTAALYYMVHSTFAGAALFLVADLVRRGQAEGMRPHGITVAFYFVAAIAMAGMPPLTGFLGKVFVLQAAAPAEGAPVIWGVILVSSLVLIVGFTRLGSALFWKTAPVPDGDPLDAGGGLALPGGLAATAAALPVAALALTTLASGPVAEAMDRTAAQLIDRSTYIRAVLDPADPSAEGLRRGGGAYDLGTGSQVAEDGDAAPAESGAAPGEEAD
ncbi:MAG: monovalent cation/H+ antiporter subunit D [Paracoccaceae bacterium]|jgi:multicomponent K+:H+ antiporter subunit D|nr:monovalent cation/H+ antiporter subunit D [Paracoccaceae bacterium]